MAGDFGGPEFSSQFQGKHYKGGDICTGLKAFAGHIRSKGPPDNQKN